MASIVERLTENVVERNLLREGAALSKKWEKTGLLEGIDNSMTKTTMARLLENQAKELLREASTMSAGDVEGFAAVAFPIVRRVFGGLIANELVAVQPMSLPSGLIFFLDFNYASNSNRLAYYGANLGDSVYGGGVLASQITGGVSLTASAAEKGFYNLNNGFSSATGSYILDTKTSVTYSSGYVGGTNGSTGVVSGLSVDYDPDLVGKPVIVIEGIAPNSNSSTTNKGDSGLAQLDYNNLITLVATDISDGDSKINDTTTSYDASTGVLTITCKAAITNYFKASGDYLKLRQVRRLTKVSTKADTAINASNAVRFKLVFEVTGMKSDSVVATESTDNATNATLLTNAQEVFTAGDGTAANKGLSVSFARKDSFSTTGLALGAVVADTFFLEGSAAGTADVNSETGVNLTIPEIDIKVDSIAVTAQTKKLKAKWSPELGQDLNAYHNLDAEVELTSILSEHVALEIDQEILNDLVKGATAGTKYWSRRPGKFVNRDTGAAITSVGAPPDFTGNVSMWYETLVETINDVSAQIHRKTLRGGANFLVTSPEVANLLEFTSGFRADINMEELKGGSVGAVKAGSISKKWDVYVDPYFPRNLILVGRRGKAFLESGYVYAPYVPLMITPTIFGTEDFVPRKGLMTRYAKKMVRPDMFGLVVVQDLIG